MSDEFYAALHISQHLKGILYAAFAGYQRWLSEGKPPYATKQYYYDSYHDCISFDADAQRYHYSIQLSDSPDGDTWVAGTFCLDDKRCLVDVQMSMLRY